MFAVSTTVTLRCMHMQVRSEDMVKVLQLKAAVWPQNRPIAGTVRVHMRNVCQQARWRQGAQLYPSCSLKQYRTVVKITFTIKGEGRGDGSCYGSPPFFFF